MRARMAAALLAVTALSLGGCGVFKGKAGPTTPTVGNRVPILGNSSDLAVDSTTAAMEVVLPAPTQNTEWTQPGGNAGKTMSHVALGGSITQAWSTSSPGGSNRARLAASPVVSGGTVFVMDTEGRVRAFDAATGAARWATLVSGEAGGTARARFGGGVSVENGTVYAVTGLGDVAALDAATGTARWTVRPSGPLRGAPTIAFGMLFVVSQDNQLYALRTNDGRIEWQEGGSIAPGSVFGVAAPAAAQGTIIAGYSSGELNAYRYENGRPLWADALARTSAAATVSTLVDIDADPVIDRGRVFAIGQGGRMAGYDLLSGQRIWDMNIGGISTPWVAGEWVFVVTDDSRVFNISRTTGKIRWIGQLPQWRDAEKKTGKIRWTGPVLAGGRLLLVSTDGHLAQVNPSDGSVISTTEISGETRLAPVVADNTLYILDDSGRLSAWR